MYIYFCVILYLLKNLSTLFYPILLSDYIVINVICYLNPICFTSFYFPRRNKLQTYTNFNKINVLLDIILGGFRVTVHQYSIGYIAPKYYGKYKLE